MGEQVLLDIANEYSPYPSGRDDRDGPYNGKRFRDEFLLPRFLKAEKEAAPLVVHLEGVMSFGSSFLEEAFGGLIRVSGISKRQLLSLLQIDEGRPSNQRYKDAILRYIDEAKAG